MRMHLRAACAMSALLLNAALLGGCGRRDETEETVVQFDTGTVTIATNGETTHMKVELATTETQQEYGLMDRTHLDPERGMLFVYPEVQDSGSGFWMFRTKIPLDIAFIDSTGTIVAIRSMEPCTSPVAEWCQPGYTPGRRYQSGLEVNRGFFQKHGIGVGARLQRVQ
jgi:uncharacterized protein